MLHPKVLYPMELPWSLQASNVASGLLCSCENYAANQGHLTVAGKALQNVQACTSNSY